MDEKNPVIKAILERRTIRKFKQEKIPEETLRKLVDAARTAPSGGNLQPLEYLVVSDEAICVEMFKYVKWAGYIAPNGNPKEGEKPTAYVIVLVDKDEKSTTALYDAGAAIENLILAAWAEGIGACWQGAINRDGIRTLFKIPMDFDVDSVVSLGYKGEDPVTEDYKGSVKYWKDDKGQLHVPKRKTEEVIHWNKYTK